MTFNRLLLIRIPGFLIPVAYFFSPSFVLFFSALNYSQDVFNATQDPNFTDPVFTDLFDFIVVGGGSAGAVVANRLSLHNRVLLLEAGGDANPLSRIPVTSPILLGQPNIDWRHRTVPQTNASLGLAGRVGRFPRGKALGGTSTLNSMIYMRGHPKDYDNWAQITGDPRWKYDALLPFFKKLEDYHGHFPNKKEHGTGGPIHIEKLRFAPAMDVWLEAGKEMGYTVRDLNGHQIPSFAPMDVTMKMGTRFDTARAYLTPIRDRENLVVYRYAQVVKIHLDKGRPRHAYGVTYQRHGKVKFVRASKEVIVSAGSINSPHLLLLSGIGPNAHLNSKGIKCRRNLPVGRNLQDHVFTTVGPVLVKQNASLLADRDVTVQSLTDFFGSGTGPLVSITGMAGAAGISSTLSSDSSWPDIYYHFIGGGVHRSLGADQEKSFGFKRGFLKRFYDPVVGRDAFFYVVTLARPKSRGRIWLKSNDPGVKPLIDPRFLHHPDDMTVMLQGVNFTLEMIARTRTMRNLGAHLSPYPLPTCVNHPFGSEEYWRCYIRYYSITIHHQCCTVPMGSGDRRNSVLDSKLRVLGTTGLRVIDASIFPVIMNANPNIPTIMVGEIGSSMIREYWTSQFEICTLQGYLTYKDKEKCYYSKFV